MYNKAGHDNLINKTILMLFVLIVYVIANGIFTVIHTLRSKTKGWGIFHGTERKRDAAHDL